MAEKTLYIGSNDQYRLSGTESDFTYQLEIDSSQYNKVVVLAASIPVSYYLVENGDEFFISENGSAEVSVSITAGNYNVNSFITVLTAALNAASPNGWTYSMSFPNASTSAQTGKFTYNIAGTGITSAYFKMTYSVIYNQLGFDVNTTNNFTVSSPTSARLVSTNCVDFVPINSIYILSDIVSGDISNQYNILQEIYSPNAVPFSNITYLCPNQDNYAKNLSNQSGNVFRFTITDANSGSTIDTNGLPVYITLKVFRQDDTHKLLKEFIKYTILRYESKAEKTKLIKNEEKELPENK